MSVRMQFVGGQGALARLVAELALMVLAAVVFAVCAVAGLVAMVDVLAGPRWSLTLIAALVLAVSAVIATLVYADLGGTGRAARMDRRTGRRAQSASVRAADGTLLHVEVDGPDDAEITVVFCHGWMGDLTSWREQRRALRGTALRRVFYDQRGHGRSGWRGMDRGTAGVGQLADDLAAVIEAVAPDGPLFLVGHSMGGMTIMAFAERHPEVMRYRVDGVLLCATTATPLADEITLGLPPERDRTQRFVRRYAVAAVTLCGLLPPRLVQLLGVGPFRLSTSLLALAPGAHPTARVATTGALFRTPLSVAGRCLQAVLEHDGRGSLGGLDPTRVTVVVPGQDRLIPTELQRQVAELAGHARVVTAPGAGHMVTLEQPELVAAELLALVVLTLRRPADLMAG